MKLRRYFLAGALFLFIGGTVYGLTNKCFIFDKGFTGYLLQTSEDTPFTQYPVKVTSASGTLFESYKEDVAQLSDLILYINVNQIDGRPFMAGKINTERKLDEKN